MYMNGVPRLLPLAFILALIEEAITLVAAITQLIVTTPMPAVAIPTSDSEVLYTCNPECLPAMH